MSSYKVSVVVRELAGTLNIALGCTKAPLGAQLLSVSILTVTLSVGRFCLYNHTESLLVVRDEPSLNLPATFT